MGYDGAGRLFSVTDDASGVKYVSGITYNPSGTPNQTTFANDLLQQTNLLNSRLQVAESRVGPAGTTSYYLDRQYFFGDSASLGQQFASASNNNDDLMHVLDSANGASRSTISTTH